MSLYAVILFGCAIVAFVDAVRHVALGWLAFARWDATLSPQIPVKARLRSAGSARPSTWINPAGDAPTPESETYRRHATWALAEMVVFVLACVLVVFTS
jgi:hypothetical protein